MQEYDMASLNDCNDGKRGSDVLMTTLEKCQKIVAKNVELEKKLEIAKEALEKAKTAASFGRIKGINVDTPDGIRLKSIMALTEQALKQIRGE